MASLLSHLLALLLGGGITFAAVVYAILANPEKVDKWMALIFKAALKIGVLVKIARKKYV